jgi:hypothetical protein
VFGQPVDSNEIILFNGVVLYVENQPLSNVPGAVLDEILSLSINQYAETAFVFQLDFAGTGRRAVVVNDQLFLLKNDLVGVPELGASSYYTGFSHVKLNNLGQLLLHCGTLDPAMDTFGKSTLMFHDLVAASQKLVMRSGLLLPDGSAVATQLGMDPQESAINDLGEVLYLTYSSGFAVHSVFVDDTLVARTGLSSPRPGSNYDNLVNLGLDLNASGSFFFQADLDDGTDLLVRNHQIVIERNVSVPPDTAPFPISSLGTTNPNEIDERGRVYWFGSWNQPSGTGLFRDDELLVQEGTVTDDGLTLSSLGPFTAHSFHVSPSGEWLVAIVLASNLSALLVVRDLSARGPCRR